MAASIDIRLDNAAAITYLVRQSIHDRNKRVWGYALLHRANDTRPTDTRSVILTAGLDVGLARVSGHHRVLVGFDADTLLSGVPTTLPPSQLVLEVSAAVVSTPVALRALHDLARRGYAIALDWTADAVEHPGLVALASMVRLDAEDLSPEALTAHAARLRAAGKKLIARNVVDAATYERCHRLGFELFQGPFLRRVETVAGRHVAPERAAAMSLLSKIQDPATTFADLCALIHRDPVLSYQLVRFVGSAAFARPVRVDSVQRALILLGLMPVRQWAALLLLARAAAHDEHALVLAMTRAKMAEALAARLSKNPTAAFTVGLFSALEHLLGEPLADLLAELPLEADVSRALLGGGGYLGDILQTILLYEDGIASGHELGVSAVQVVDAYLAGIEWAENARSELSASA